jgi:tetratricopeptide (TPR) repeat protein
VQRRVLRSAGDRIDFTHDWVREVTAGELPSGRRRLLHRRVGEAMEALYAADLAPHALALGQHSREGEVWDRAAVYFRQAGVQAAGRVAHREAVACFEQALAAVAHVPGTLKRLELGIDVRLELRHTLAALGELEAIGACVSEAEALARELGDATRQARVALASAQYLYLAGDYEGTVGHAGRVLDTAGAMDLETGVEAGLRAALAYFDLGRYRTAISILDATLSRLPGESRRAYLGQPFLPAVRALGWLAMSLGRLGEFDRARRSAAEALELAETAGDPQSLLEALDAVADVHHSRGELLQALEPFERAVAICRAWHLRTRLPSFYGVIAAIYAEVGRTAEASALYREAKAEDDAMGRRSRRARRVGDLGRAALLEDRIDEASTLADRARDMAREFGQRAIEASTLKLAAQIAIRRAPPDLETAENACREAIALSVELETRPFEAGCRLDLAAVYRRQHRLDDARLQVFQAREMFRAMGMTGPLERAGAELALLAAPPDRAQSPLTSGAATP